MLHVKEVVSNLKGGVSAKLGPKTLIIGPNGTGKSAIPQAVALALRGVVEDISGRAEVASDVELMSLAPGRNGKLWSTVTLSNGETVAGSLERVKGKVKKWSQTLNGVDVPPVRANIYQRSFPLAEVRAAVLGSADTARRFFVKHAVGVVSQEDVLKTIAKIHHERYLEIVKEWSKDLASDEKREASLSGPLLALLSAEAVVKARKSEAKSRADTFDEIIKAGTAGLSPQPTEDQLLDVDNRVAGQKLAVEVQQRKVWEMQSAAARPSPLTKPVPQEYLDVRGVLAYSVNQQLDHCVTCGTAGVGEHFAKRLDVVERDILSIQGRIEAAPVVDSGAEDARLNAMAVLAAMKRDLELLEEEQRAWRDTASRWASFNRARDQAEGERKKQDEYERMGEALRKARTTLLDSSISAFELRVQKYLPETDRFGLRLREGDREVLQFGLLRDIEDAHVPADEQVQLLTALSGAEWARVIVALAAAVAEREMDERGTDADRLAILVPEDRSWDEKTLRAVLAALEAFPGQVIVATTTVPAPLSASDELLSWQVIRTGEFARHDEVVAANPNEEAVRVVTEPAPSKPKKAKANGKAPNKKKASHA